MKKTSAQPDLTTIKVPGIAEPPGEIRLSDQGKEIFKNKAVRTKAAVAIDAVRSAGAAPVEIKDIGGDDVIEVELEGGFRLVTTWGRFQERYPGQASRDAKSGEATFPTSLSLGGPARGGAAWVIKGLKILGVDLEPKFSNEVRLAVGLLEQGLMPEPGLHHFPKPEEFGLKRVKEGTAIATREPLLVFIHGTGSSTKGSFGALWPSEPGETAKPQAPEIVAVRDRLVRQYGDRIYAFEHHTLTESPIANALALAGALPAGAELHLVTHSRGGMIGELLCRCGVAKGEEPFQEADLDVLRQAAQDAEKELKEARDQQAGELEKLNALLKEKRFKITRFVRVACPARGTTLASERLDTWLSIMVHLVGLIPGLKTNPVYQFLSDLLLLVAKERTKPETLPGLEAMMPASPLVRLLNRPGPVVSSDLSVIAGDIEERSLLGRLKLLLPDLFYAGDHDLIVDTRSMDGGARRPEGAARFFFDQGPEVCHFNYFRNPKTAAQLLARLTQNDESLAAFQPIEGTSRGVFVPKPRRDGRPRPVVIIVPGIMGTHLKVGGNRIWMDLFDLAIGGMKKLKIDAANVQPDEVMGSAYGEVMEYLDRTHEVVAFPYDWRRSIREEAKRLAELVSGKLESAGRADQPVRILAHSMGGLVTRTMFASFPDVWTRLTKHPGGRFVMLGTPNGGSYTIPRILVAQEKTVRQLALLDFTQSQEQLLTIISRFPGVLEMLPQDEQHEFYEPKFWEDLVSKVGAKPGWVTPSRDALDAARTTRELLDHNPPQSDRILYVAGCAPVTPVAMELLPEGGKTKIGFQGSQRGDGRVPWSSGIPSNVRCWYMEGVVHGDLAAHEPAFPAILELLQTGTTTRLATTPPVTERGVERTFPLEPDRVDVYPNEEDLGLAVSGSRARRRNRTKRAKTNVAIAHGNLAYARHPILVGHYVGDGIFSAEAYLDRTLGGALRTRHTLGLYPGPLQTVEVLLQSDPHRRPAGAIVVGLGRAGELSPNALLRTTANAVLRYALTQAERKAEGGEAEGTPVSVKLSALLVGSGGGALTVQDSVMSVLRGVRQAIRRLEERKQLREVTFDEIEFVELFEDRALEAACALDAVTRDRELQEDFACEPRLRLLDGRRRRAMFDEDRGWWHRLQVTAEKDGSLKYLALTQKARAEQTLLPTQRLLLDQFIANAISQTLTNSDIARTLFEQLLPNYLKDQAGDRQDLVLVLNEEAAAYPWELLEDRYSPNREPLSVQAGVVRQLETSDFRQQVVRTTRKGALVIGEPDPDETGLPPLAGAETEAQTVSEVLTRRGFTVRTSIRDGASTIVQALHEDPYRILHLAGHGVHEYLPQTQTDSGNGGKPPAPGTPPQRVSGMVIGKDVFLTPADVEQMRRVPDLVFINCCHLGRVDSSPAAQAAKPPAWNKLAANLAAQFIRMGVKAVVAAGWAVDDQAAGTFARKFYDELLLGVPFGRAVLAARKEAYGRHSGVNTWGAYQCYGDPEFRLQAEAGPGDAGPPPTEFHSAAEFCVELDGLVSRADNADPDELKQLARRLERLAEAAERNWSKSAEVLSKLATAWGEFHRFQEAVKCLSAALACEKAELSVKAIEQACNYQTRYAVECWRQSPRGNEAEKLIQQASRRLQKLLSLGRTKERLNLLASAEKRLAWVTTGQARSAALTRMRAHYEAAAALARAGGGKGDHYSEFNLAAAKLLEACAEGSPKPEVLDETRRDAEAAKLLAQTAHAERPDFWTTFAVPDCGLLAHLAAREAQQNLTDPTVLAGICRQYRSARELASSPLKLASVADQLDFIIEILGGLPLKSGLRAQIPALQQVRATLA